MVTHCTKHHGVTSYWVSQYDSKSNIMKINLTVHNLMLNNCKYYIINLVLHVFFNGYLISSAQEEIISFSIAWRTSLGLAHPVLCLIVSHCGVLYVNSLTVVQIKSSVTKNCSPCLPYMGVTVETTSASMDLHMPNKEAQMARCKDTSMECPWVRQ